MNDDTISTHIALSPTVKSVEIYRRETYSVLNSESISQLSAKYVYEMTEVNVRDMGWLFTFLESNAVQSNNEQIEFKTKHTCDEGRKKIETFVAFTS